MKIKPQFTLATLIVAGLFATGCQQMSQQTAQQTAAPAPVQEAPVTTPAQNKDSNYHCHEEAPACATKCHSHPFSDPNHKHVYGCVAGAKRAPVVPQVKAKGNYKGPVNIDRNVMQQYQR